MYGNYLFGRYKYCLYLQQICTDIKLLAMPYIVICAYKGMYYRPQYALPAYALSRSILLIIYLGEMQTVDLRAPLIYLWIQIQVVSPLSSQYLAAGLAFGMLGKNRAVRDKLIGGISDGSQVQLAEPF